MVEDEANAPLGYAQIDLISPVTVHCVQFLCIYSAERKEVCKNAQNSGEGGDTSYPDPSLEIPNKWCVKFIVIHNIKVYIQI